LIALMCTASLAFAEIIITKDGRNIQAKISEVSVETNTIWYELESGEINGEIIEEISIDISEVDRVLNDDGSLAYLPSSDNEQED
jgi:hypothetical protein